MLTQTRLRLTGLLMIGFGLLTGASFEGLRQTFQYPDILRMGTGYVLTEYHRLAATVQPFWYGMVVGSICLMIAALLLHESLKALSVRHLSLLTGLGVLAGLFNTLGFMRWVFMVPALAATYTDPTATEATRQAAAVIFNAFHLYLGFSVGEHLGFMFLGFWGLGLSLALLPVAGFPRWLSWLGIAAAVGTFGGILEGAGWAVAADIVAISSSVQIVWIMLVGVYLLRVRLPNGAVEKPHPTRQPRTPAALPVSKLMLPLALLGTAGAAQAQSGDKIRFSRQELSINAFRNPSIGLEYRLRRVSAHVGYYPTILNDNAQTEGGQDNNTTSFVRAGLSYWFLPIYSTRKAPSSFYGSAAYVRGLDYDYHDRNGLMGEVGFRWVVWQGLNLRLGVAALKATNRDWQINPTPGISYSFFIR